MSLIRWKIPLLLSILMMALIFFGAQVMFYVILTNRSTNSICSPTTNLNRGRLAFDWRSNSEVSSLPIILVITPTYARYVQQAELTRLSHTFILVPNLHWIIVEDSTGPTQLVSRMIERLKEEFQFRSITQLHTLTPNEFKPDGQVNLRKPRGVWQRNEGLRWIRENSKNLKMDEVIYFADDDNTYDLKVFEEMRWTRKMSVWPVGLIGGLLAERPLVQDGKVVGFGVRWGRRKYAVDMAGFAVSAKEIIQRPDIRFSDRQHNGYIETNFIDQVVDSIDELEPKAANCSQVLVWHTRALRPYVEKHELNAFFNST